MGTLWVRWLYRGLRQWSMERIALVVSTLTRITLDKRRRIPSTEMELPDPIPGSTYHVGMRSITLTDDDEHTAHWAETVNYWCGLLSPAMPYSDWDDLCLEYKIAH